MPRGLKLYVQRVFIMDEADQFLPLYLRFIRGIVDSNDLPLNVSRELLQQSEHVVSIRNALTKRVLDMLAKMAEEDSEKYGAFWDEFGQVLKEGAGEDASNRDGLLNLMRFTSTADESAAQRVALATYKERAKEEQKKIYFVLAENLTTARQSPHLEVFKQQGIEVLLLSDRVDEWLMSFLTEFDGWSFQDIMRQIMAATGQSVPDSKPHFEINGDHPLVGRLDKESDEDRFSDMVLILFDQASLADGSALLAPGEYVHRINRLLLDLLK